MSEFNLVIPTGKGEKRLKQMFEFAKGLIKVSGQIGFRISSRGWCYQLEGFGLINKSQFNRVEGFINKCRQIGFLPIDFVAEEDARSFSGVEIPTDEDPVSYMKRYLEATLNVEDYYTPKWWSDEKYYIQMIVEKIDLKTLFKPVCNLFHIPIATSRGWSSMLQRAEYALRFKQAEEQDLECVLLYCGDHDPDGLRISDFLRNNLRDLSSIRWSHGEKGYDPTNLIIDRFGLNYDFIEENQLSWTDNLITGSGKNLANPNHPNYNLPYMQEYLEKYGERKCEANALVIIPQKAKQLCIESIEKYLGTDALSRFRKVRQKIVDEINEFRDDTGINETIQEAIQIIDDREA